MLKDFNKRWLTYAIVVSLAVSAFAAWRAQAQVAPADGVYVSAASGNVAAESAAATLAAAAGKHTFICGFTATGSGAGGASVVNITVTGLVGGTATFNFSVPVGPTVGITTLVVNFGTCIPSSALNTAIVVTLPSLGVGNTHAAVFAWGLQL